MQFFTYAKFAFAIFQIGVVVASPAALEARQLTCLAELCTPGPSDACCPGAACTSISALGLMLTGVCTPAACDVICSETVPCCTDVPDTTFTCQLLPGQSEGVCIPEVI
ncbi:hypothetical protein BV20DRAFT_969524 [Pilatotrama ljubarskyi]|nr:hypothetical protein BV20DRAFT_969524 [Pilatotrama ljubarskyi]